ncbi:MAG TPA: hypothetical protein VFK31_09550 [Rhodanobacteraceae bacterium]|nr:hypothetical protein [Rhodanobacteraceae bacterium]
MNIDFDHIDPEHLLAQLSGEFRPARDIAHAVGANTADVIHALYFLPAAELRCIPIMRGTHVCGTRYECRLTEVSA